MALNWPEFQAGTGGWRSRMVKGDALAASTHAVVRWRCWFEVREVIYRKMLERRSELVGRCWETRTEVSN